MALLATTATASVGTGAEAVLFWIFAAIAVGSGIAMISMRNIVHAALMLVLNFLCIAALYLGLQSSFLSIVQIIVYAGAIVVLFLFVIMLLGVDRDDLMTTGNRLRAVAAVLAGVALAGALLVVVADGALTDASACGALAGTAVAGEVSCIGLDDALAESDSVTFVASRLFTRWTVPFEIAALLLVVATLGALVLGRRHDDSIDDGLDPSAPLPDLDDVDEVAARQAAENADPDDVELAAAGGAAVATAAEVEVEVEVEVEDHHHGGYGHGDHTGHDHSMIDAADAAGNADAAPADDTDATPTEDV